LQNQMQNVPGIGSALGGIGGDQMQISSQMPQSSGNAPSMGPVNPISQDYPNPQINQIPNRGNAGSHSNPYEEEKYGSQPIPSQQYGQSMSSYPQPNYHQMKEQSYNNPIGQGQPPSQFQNQQYDYQANSGPTPPFINNPNSSHDNLNRSFDHHSQSRQGMPSQQPNYVGRPGEGQPSYQQPSYSYGDQYGVNKLQKVDEFGQGQPPNKSYQPNDVQNYGMQNLQVQQNRYPQEKLMESMPENPPTLNQISQNLNTQSNLPSLQSSGMQTTQQNSQQPSQQNNPNQQFPPSQQMNQSDLRVRLSCTDLSILKL
jgi:hypothetical protein